MADAATREERAERFLRRLKSGDPDAKRILGMAARYTASQGQERATLAPAREVYGVGTRDGDEAETVAVDAPSVVRRSRTARLDSMIARLKDLPPALLEAKIRDIQGEFFKLGMPVAYEDLRSVAAFYLNRADTNRTPEIRATRSTESTGRA